MSVWRTLGTAVFTGERSWAWRRRMAFAGCAVFLWGIVYAIRFEPEPARAALVLQSCIGGWLGTMGIYYTGSHADAAARLKAEGGQNGAPS